MSSLSHTTTSIPKATRKKSGYWKNISNQRAFFDSMASTLNLTSAKEWSNINTSTLLKMGGSFVYSKYKGSLAEGNDHTKIE
jgi:hypothetical protein